jgi:hypothetical protein
LLPGAVFENNQAAIVIGRPVKIVVPGTVERSRRDYTQVVDLVCTAQASGLQPEITLLGAAKEKILQPGIITYDGVVPQPEFDEKVRGAHFLFAPIVPGTVSPDGTREIYGTTKASGNIFDIIRYAKPAFVPDYIEMPPDLESACLRYHSVEEIVAQIKKMTDDPNLYRVLERNALESSLNYTVEKIRAGNPELFN